VVVVVVGLMCQDGSLLGLVSHGKGLFLTARSSGRRRRSGGGSSDRRRFLNSSSGRCGSGS